MFASQLFTRPENLRLGGLKDKSPPHQHPPTTTQVRLWLSENREIENTNERYKKNNKMKMGGWGGAQKSKASESIKIMSWMDFCLF